MIHIEVPVAVGNDLERNHPSLPKEMKTLLNDFQIENAFMGTTKRQMWCTADITSEKQLTELTMRLTQMLQAEPEVWPIMQAKDFPEIFQHIHEVIGGKVLLRA